MNPDPHLSDVSPEPQPIPLDLAESLVPDYALARAIEFAAVANTRTGESKLRNLAKAVYHLQHYLEREARRQGVAVTYQAGLPVFKARSET